MYHMHCIVGQIWGDRNRLNWPKMKCDRNRLHCQFNHNRRLLSRLNLEIFILHHCTLSRGGGGWVSCFINVGYGNGRNCVVKCEGDGLVSNQDSHRVDAELTFFMYRFSIEVFWGQHSSRFVLADDLHINILTLVAGHGAIASLLPLISYWIQTRTAM